MVYQFDAEQMTLRVIAARRYGYFFFQYHPEHCFCNKRFSVKFQKVKVNNNYLEVVFGNHSN